MTRTNVTCNADQRVFVIQHASGYSCFGFANCFAHAKQLSELLRRPDLAPREEDIGDLKQYALYQDLIDLARIRGLGTYFDPGTLPQVKDILERYRLSGEKLRLFYGDDVTGRDWLEEHDVLGRIGRSMGPLQVPLIIGPKATGGPAILTKCLVRILDGATMRELYRHPQYHLPQLTVEPCSEGKYKAEVRANGDVHVRFTTEAKAQNWIAFMQGERMKR